MSKLSSVFIDADVLVYFLDETAMQHVATIALLQELVDAQVGLYTSHHVIEEVLYIVSKLAAEKDAAGVAIQNIAALPGLALIEPEADFSFANRYVKLWQLSSFGINDALLLQLIIDAGIECLFSFDKALLKKALSYDIKTVNVQSGIA
jgi:predicted nucleic acid-binding protein